ncbi:unnamed protein product [Chilo suppressalis]|uniref:Cubilin n=1 Tax=Chilo suppressalis TaxID=168631 RepID=A0ABN8ATP8_CHISP|nr:unnamed protein product [Chilo suppressalis]
MKIGFEFRPLKMSTILIRCLYFVVWFVQFECQKFQGRPKISTSNGHLILEAAQDQNIYLRTNGPKSGIYVQDINLLHLSVSDNSEKYPIAPNDNFEKYLNGPNGIISRLERLEEQIKETPRDAINNITFLIRKVNRLNNRISNFQSLIRDKVKDECQNNPCQNAGTCLNLVDGYHCLCPSNWEGKNCDIDVNECRNFAGTDLGCQNGATCINRPGTYECFCASGWFGIHCTRRAKDCSAGNYEMCGFGTCVPVTSGEGIKCICNQGWETNGTEIACLTDVNECDSSRGLRCSANPKVDCINLPGSFRCGQCPPGYEGDGFTCHDINECETILNGGCSPLVTCHNTIGSRICGPCPPGYQGDGATCTWRGTCNINHGGCHPSAQCIDSMAVVQCICPLGMEGDGIGLQGCYVTIGGNSTQRCENNPCVNGHCHPLLSGYTCLCNKGYNGVHCDVPVDYCSSNPCQHGGTCRPGDSFTDFRCECTAEYTGNLCQMKSRSCSGVLDAEEGSLIYPLTNSSYDHNSKCAWVIHTATDKVINVTFSKFNLEPEPECMYDFLQIHDGRTSSSQLIGRFCGNDLPKGGNIISSNNNLYLWFRSDKTVAKEGFALHWESVKPVCGGEIDATTYGHINSPGSPGKYPPNRDCYWHLSTTFGKRISLHFFALDIESHANCSFDYLAIYDGEQLSDPLIKYCNSTQPAPLQSSSSEITIHFHSDAYGSGNGFQITFAPVEGIPGCGGYYTLDKGEIVSPSYNGYYLDNLLCEYKIVTGSDSKIRLDFKSFKLERSVRCRYDYLKVYDGPSANSRLVGKFCGNSYPNSYVSTSNSLFIIFKTDHSASSEGFKISFETVCQKTIFGESGIIKSPGYPFLYPSNKVCEYIIGTVPGKAIQLTFQYFDIEDNNYYDCKYDNVEIRDGSDRNATLLGKYCGGGPEHMPPVKISTHNYLYIRFTSDMSISGTGFYANFTTIDTECGGIYRETTGLIKHPSGDDSTVTAQNNQKCIWMLVAPEGMHIKLSWNKFEIENHLTCSSDYVELLEIDVSNHNESLGKFCGASYPPSLTTTTNRLMIRFLSDGSIRSTGFSLSYTFLDDKTHCGAVYAKSHGYIYSPGWPKKYEPNRDCTWVIIVPVGQQIMLNISQFDLERPIRDKCDLGDYLEIRNGDSRNSPLIGKYCGTFQSKRVTSISNNLYLRFHSDYYLTGNGFKIEWDGTITGCGGTVTSPHGTISSPNYPNDYYENAECFYRIVTSEGSRIRIRFVDLDLERTPFCKDDYVEIFDGRDETSNSFGKFCFLNPILGIIETTSNIAFVKFRSDFYIASKGFLINYDTICETNITGKYGVIESPGYPGNYGMDLNCIWTINAPKGQKINVTFTHFDILSSYRNSWSSKIRSKCYNHYLQWKETNQVDFSDKFCGSVAPRMISTASNSLQIKFVSGSFRTLTGFRLEWVSYGCGGYFKKRYGTIILDSTSFSGEMECEWLIESPIGANIMITFNSVYMTDSKNCTVDSIEVFNGQTANSPLITKFCHRSDTIQVYSTSNFMLIRLTKHSNLKDVYFSSTYNAFHYGCGSEMAATTGMLYSKNYPNNYDNNIDCIWRIMVPSNHRIELNFIDIDLYNEDEEDCNDNIKIYDGYINKNYTHIICPGTQAQQYISKSNSLYLQFVTNAQGTAKGFKANYTMTCGAIINATRDGIITNDKFLRHTNISCIWTILAPSTDQKITLTLTHMSLSKNYDISSNRSCPSSFLRIRDGDDDSSPVVGEYCGKKIPPSIVSHGYALTIELGTYDNTIEGQFSAHYTSFSSACGGTLTSEEGAIASPNYPQPYPINTDCEWTLGTSPGNRVYIVFENFNLQDSEDCNQDYVEVRENHSAGRLLGIYCGSKVTFNDTYAARLYIKFHSDNQDTDSGFMIKYGFLHGNDISGSDSGNIASPLYPTRYEGAADYSWRVTVSSGTITVRITRLEIMSIGSSCSSYLAIYDGYDDEAFLLENLCGVLNYNEKSFQTTSNVVYIKLKLDDSNTGSLFLLGWAKTGRPESVDTAAKNPNCGSNGTQIVEPDQVLTLTSPNYPSSYDNNLNCTWVYKATPGYHLRLQFRVVRLEETSGCFADSISIFTSDNLMQWQPIKQKVCLFGELEKNINASTYVKIAFLTDSSINAKGFQATLRSQCGGILTDISGKVSPSWYDFIRSDTYPTKCEWKIKVRPGRLIKFSFLQFNITNTLECNTFVTLHNGESSESPLLGSGKYCGFSHEERSVMTTSSNSLVITYSTNYLVERIFKTFNIWYEEETRECGSTATLNSDHTWDEITSPNYPSIPTAYTECIWKFSGPPGEILKIDFDRLDLDKDINCRLEFIEVRDGSSELAPLKERFCGTENPGTLKTSNNVLYVKYSTQKLPPNNGFKANVSIDICGGTIVAKVGEISSPGYPLKPRLKYGSMCEWHLKGNPLFTFLIQAQDIDLPESEAPCDTRVTIEESFPENNTVTILKTFCNDDIFNSESHGLIETLTNDVIIKLRIGKPSVYTQSSNYRGFRFTFNSSIPKCGGTFNTPDGYLSTPGYPRYTTLRACHWRIIVPDESRRVTLELIDADIERHRINIYNDEFHRSLIQTIPSDEYSPTTQIFESSGNTMALYIWLDPTTGSRHRFKAKYTTDKPALCGEHLIGSSGQFISPDLDRSYTCKWKYNYNAVNLANTINSTDLFANTLFLRVHINSSVSSSVCRYTDPKLSIKYTISNRGIRYNKILCKSGTNEDLRLPSPAVDIMAIKRKTGSLFFNVYWKFQPCGGVVYATENPINIINVPSAYNDSLDCAWLVIIPIGTRVKVKLDGKFQLNCQDEFVTIHSDVTAVSTKIGDYCKDKTQEDPIQLKYSMLYIQYHTKAKNETNIKLLLNTVQNQCGGYLMTYESIFESPNYPKSYTENQECTWEMKTDQGSRISLRFIGRFAVESRPNCTKDAVIVYDWKDNQYIEMSRLCGRTLPPMFNSTFNKMKVILRTDSEINLDGFQAEWVRICGGNYNATDEEQFLYSPGYPNAYSNDLYCLYRFTATDGHVLLKFLDFELEGHYPDCNNDNLTLSGESANDFLYETIYCGKEVPPVVIQEKINLVFRTDYYSGRKGFKISYKKAACGGEVTEPTTLKSNPTDYYINYMNCTWIIKAPSEKSISLRFLYFDLESSTGCYNDYLAIYEGLFINDDKRLSLLCGEGDNSSTVIRSSNNHMVLNMRTDSSSTGKGFQVAVIFTYSTSVGCGGDINLTTTSIYNLKSPLIGSNLLYEDFLDCHWTIVAPVDHVIKIKFTSFHIAPCQNVNQTALGYNQCDCDFVELVDGVAPDSALIDKFCGHTLPPELVSSGNGLVVRLFTDGEINSSGFKATLSIKESVCGQSSYTITKSVQRITSPGYETGSIPRGIHCVYNLHDKRQHTIRLNIKNIDLLPALENSNQCNRDKLVISNLKNVYNITIGKDLVLNMENDLYIDSAYLLEQQELIKVPKTFTYCGSQAAIEFYFSGSVSITVLTSAESDSATHRGVELEFSEADYCGRNYTEPYGRIKSLEIYDYDAEPKKDCYTLITAPENHTISAYFLRLSPTYWVEETYLEIFDGKLPSDRRLKKIGIEYNDILSVSSTGRNMLIHSRVVSAGYISYDLTYVTTDKGPGCGGTLKNEVGKITSPMYPSVYRRRSTCEWELETPIGTRLHLRFSVFDLGRACDQIYLQLIDRHGKTSTFCSETPADYISEDNYVKIVFTTTMNNGGTGWVAEFVGVKLLTEVV